MFQLNRRSNLNTYTYIDTTYNVYIYQQQVEYIKRPYTHPICKYTNTFVYVMSSALLWLLCDSEYIVYLCGFLEFDRFS